MMSCKASEQTHATVSAKADSLQQLVQTLKSALIHATFTRPAPAPVADTLPPWVWLVIVFNLVYFGYKAAVKMGCLTGFLVSIQSSKIKK